jgi:hypothetical protein
MTLCEYYAEHYNWSPRLFGGRCTTNRYPNYQIQINFASRNLLTTDGQQNIGNTNTTTDHWDQAIVYSVSCTVKMKIISFAAEFRQDKRFAQSGGKK